MHTSVWARSDTPDRLIASLRSAKPDSVEYLTARRNLRSLGQQEKSDFPRWLPYLITLVASAVVAYAVIEDHRSVSTVVATAFVAIVMVIAGFSLPAMTKLKFGGVELEKQSVVVATRELLPAPDQRTPFAMLRDPRARSEAVRPQLSITTNLVSSNIEEGSRTLRNFPISVRHLIQSGRRGGDL